LAGVSKSGELRAGGRTEPKICCRQIDDGFREDRSRWSGFLGGGYCVDWCPLAGACAGRLLGYLLCSRLHSGAAREPVVARTASDPRFRTLRRTLRGVSRCLTPLGATYDGGVSWVPLFTQWCLTGVWSGVTVQPTSALYWEFRPLRVGQGLRRVRNAAGWSGAMTARLMVMFRKASGPTFQHLILR
jgi:hypothetical protein